MCLDEGLLQAYLDGELDVAHAVKVARHLSSCPACRERAAALEELSMEVSSVLGAYRRATEAVVSSRRASCRVLPAFGNRPPAGEPVKVFGGISQKIRRMKDMVRRYKWVYGMAAAVLALVLLLSWAPSRSLASQFLNIFRMEKIQVVKLTPEDMEQLNKLFNGQGGEANILNFGRVEVQKPEKALVEVEPEQVAAFSGLQLDLPTTLAGRKRVAIRVEQSPTITFTPDVEKLNSYLKKHGGVLLPAELAGKSFTLNIPPLVWADYGPPGKGFTLYAARDLTIDAPQGVDPVALREALLSLPFLPDNFRRQLAAINDWQHTLPIPETRDMRVREITVNGHQGVCFYDDAAPDGQVVLAWRQSNSWRAISGLPLEEALRVAAEVK
ncbi:MAG: anti-sigma factor family protein [Moorellaceae bacterium]